MDMKFAILCATLLSVAAAIRVDQQPLYKYRYETEDFMKTSASEVPLRGYHVAEGSFFQPSYYTRPQFDQFIPSRFAGGDYYREPFTDTPYYNGRIGGPFYNKGLDQGYFDKVAYNDEKKNVEGKIFENSQGDKGVKSIHGSEGISKGQISVKDAKGDTGYYKDEGGAKKAYDDSNIYSGGQHYQKEGQNEQNKKQNSNFKKGHSTKGFKKTHHKDESGKTESYYDEANDEGGTYSYGGSGGSFGEKGQASYKGGHENGEFNSNEKGKQGKYDRQHVSDNTNADKGEYGKKEYNDKGEIYKYNNGIGQQSILGRQEANREFVRRYPYGYIPFYTGY